jgi:hypothetical protein
MKIILSDFDQPFRLKNEEIIHSTDAIHAMHSTIVQLYIYMERERDVLWCFIK